MEKRYIYGVFVGRFQPFHNGDEQVVKHALSCVRKLIIVLGSDRQPRTVRNPWSTDARIKMIRSCFSDEENKAIEFVPVRDSLYNENAWIVTVQGAVDNITNGSKSVCMFGTTTNGNHYSKQFPQWEYFPVVDKDADGLKISSQRIREMYFRMDLIDIKRLVPPPVFDILKRDQLEPGLAPNPQFLQLQEEFRHINEYKQKWANSPFPPTFVTLDAVVIKSGHVLVVRRKEHPGKRLIALPGGFLNPEETLINGCLREVKEETSIKLPKDELLKSLRDQRVFDHPFRSLRGRTITHAYCFHLGSGPLPQVKGADDADKAWWMPLQDVYAREEEFFEDHFHVISYFTMRT